MQNIHTHAWHQSKHFEPATVKETDLSRGYPIDLTVDFDAFVKDCEPFEKVAVFGLKGRLTGYWVPDQYVADFVAKAPEKLVGNPELSRLDFPLLCDPANKVRQAYRGLMAENLIAQDASGASFASMLFLLDRYNAPYAALIGSKASRQAGVYASAADYVADVFSRGDVQEEILGWLRYISIQCPE